MADASVEGSWRSQSYSDQEKLWPREGRHVLAQFDESSIIVYQAYCPSIAEYALKHQKFGGDKFSYSRMCWIKTNFLWMMHRCGWASKPGQERVLAVRIARNRFDQILSMAMTGQDEKQQPNPVKSDIRLQWDPDHSPSGAPLKRRAIQLGLRNEVLRKYGTEWIMSITDVTGFVHEQCEAVKSNQLDRLMVAEERVYPVANQDTAKQIKVDIIQR